MSFKEVNSLRKSGKLSQAAEMSKADMLNDALDIWNRRGAVWVYYEYMKIAAKENKISEFLLQLDKISKLKLPAGEKIVFDSMAWAVGKFLFANNNISSGVLSNIFRIIKDLPFDKPSDSYSFLLKSFKKHSGDWQEFTAFVYWWGLDNFQSTDYENYISEQGNKTPSLVESICIAISKQLLIEQNNKTSIEKFLPFIEHISNNYKRMQYPAYYYGLLLLRIGNKDLFLKAFIPFVKKKQKDFWVWSHLAEAFDKDSNDYFMSLCMSLYCGAPNKFTIKVRKDLADVFIRKKMFSEAKYELSVILITRQKEGWPLKEEHLNWLKYKWWDSAKVIKDNNNSYYKNGNNCKNQLLFSDVATQIAVVTHVNTDKKVFSFIVSKEIYGFSNYSIFGILPKKGDFIEIKLMPKKDAKSNFYKLYSLCKTKENASENIAKYIKGNIVINPGNSYGLIGNVFVSPNLVKNYELKNGQKINALAIQSYNKNRKSWGWQVISILNKS